MKTFRGAIYRFQSGHRLTQIQLPKIKLALNLSQIVETASAEVINNPYRSSLTDKLLD
jgi:hypothetical protein